MPIIKTENGTEYEVLAEVSVMLVPRDPAGPLDMTDIEREFVETRMKAMLMQQVGGWLAMVCGLDPDAPVTLKIVQS